MKKKMIIAIIIAIPVILLLALYVKLHSSPQALDGGDTLPWEPGYASPKQYYEENGQKLKSISKIIDGIKYTFDDIGNARQDENEGEWLDDSKYQLVSGVELKNTWYEIDGQWYYFDSEGITIKDSLIKINNKRYFFNDKGELVREPFSLQSYQYGTTYSGEVMNKGAFWANGEYYVVNELGYGNIMSTGAIEFKETPQIMWKDIVYYIDSPAYFFKKDYSLEEKVMESVGSYPLKEGESFNLTIGAEIYTKNNETNTIYIYDEINNSFFRYTPLEKMFEWWTLLPSD